MSQDETDIGKLWLAAVPYHLPHVNVFRNAIVRGTMATGWYANAGIEGHGDAWWVAPPSMYRLYYGQIEWKAKRGTMRQSQLRWQAHCVKRGIPYLVLRVAKDETPDQTVSRWVNELGDAIR